VTALTEEFWSNKTVLVTGGAGFFGSAVVGLLRQETAAKVVVPRKADCDLRVQASVKELFSSVKPDIVIHLAGLVGGIAANIKYPADFFYDNAMMGLNVIEESKNRGVKKFTTVGSICAYPKGAAIPLREDGLWAGHPEPTNGPYGIAKRILLTQLEAYRLQHGLSGIYLIPGNLYGPRDSFDLNRSHVVPATIIKCITAKEAGTPKLTFWGSGKPIRDFIYVDDGARGLLLATEKYDSADAINIAAGKETSIRELVETVADLVGFSGEIEWDTSKPDGEMRRSSDPTKALETFGFRASTDLREGLRKTIEWYRAKP
jgi:GDP-L-fucose synthase